MNFNWWILFSPLCFCLYGIGFYIKDDNHLIKIDRRHLIILLGWMTTLGYSVFFNGRLLFINTFFTCLIAGYGFSETIKFIGSQDNLIDILKIENKT